LEIDFVASVRINVSLLPPLTSDFGVKLSTPVFIFSANQLATRLPLKRTILTAPDPKFQKCLHRVSVQSSGFYVQFLPTLKTTPHVVAFAKNPDSGRIISGTAALSADNKL
jgi:hypothetical protein